MVTAPAQWKISIFIFQIVTLFMIITNSFIRIFEAMLRVGVLFVNALQNQVLPAYEILSIACLR